MKYKKYILKQRYPGLPVEWQAGDIVSITDPSKQFYECKNKQGFVHKSHVLETQYWGEVEEKEYEILSFRRKGNDMEFFKKDWTLGYWDERVKQFIKENSIDILSVKNLFTEEVFLIGDYIKSKFGFNIEPIKSFEIVEDILRINTENKYLIFGEKYVEKKIYKGTIDGKKMFVGDTYYYVPILDHRVLSIVITQNMDILEKDTDYIKFSSEESAREYVFMNAREISLQEIHDYMNRTDVRFLDLKILVIQRLKEKENGNGKRF